MSSAGRTASLRRPRRYGFVGGRRDQADLAAVRDRGDHAVVNEKIDLIAAERIIEHPTDNPFSARRRFRISDRIDYRKSYQRHNPHTHGNPSGHASPPSPSRQRRGWRRDPSFPGTEPGAPPPVIKRRPAGIRYTMAPVHRMWTATKGRTTVVRTLAEQPEQSDVLGSVHRLSREFAALLAIRFAPREERSGGRNDECRDPRNAGPSHTRTVSAGNQLRTRSDNHSFPPSADRLRFINRHTFRARARSGRFATVHATLFKESPEVPVALMGSARTCAASCCIGVCHR